MANIEEGTRLTGESDAPPPYGLLFPNAFKPNQIGRRLRRNLSTVPTDDDGHTSGSFFRRCWIACCCMLFILTLFFGLPIAMIVIGALNLDDCKIERLIPIWLIVMGSFQAAEVGFRVLFHGSRKEEDENQGSLDPVGCFIFAWFICGNVWVFSNWNDYTSTKYINSTINPDYCDDLTMKFSFSVIMVTYGIVGLTCCCCCLAACYVICFKEDRS